VLETEVRILLGVGPVIFGAVTRMEVRFRGCRRKACNGGKLVRAVHLNLTPLPQKGALAGARDVGSILAQSGLSGMGYFWCRYPDWSEVYGSVMEAS